MTYCRLDNIRDSIIFAINRDRDDTRIQYNREYFPVFSVIFTEIFPILISIWSEYS